jgi:hypothetical protein
MRRNGRDAPIPAVRGTIIKPQGSTHSGHSSGVILILVQRLLQRPAAEPGAFHCAPNCEVKFLDD